MRRRRVAVLDAAGLFAGYGGMTAVSGVDLAVAAGKRLAVVGRNGAGKTTLLKALMGLAPARAERLSLAGRDLRAAPPVVTLTGPSPSGGVRVTGGGVHLRFVTDVGSVTTEVSESSPPPGAKPLVTVRRRRADGLPDVTVTGGLARVQILDEEV